MSAAAKTTVAVRRTKVFKGKETILNLQSWRKRVEFNTSYCVCHVSKAIIKTLTEVNFRFHPPSVSWDLQRLISLEFQYILFLLQRVFVWLDGSHSIERPLLHSVLVFTTRNKNYIDIYFFLLKLSQ